MSVDIFFSYAHEDEELLNRLQKHLIPLYRERLIDLLWHDRNISAGTEWEQEIDTYLNRAQIILLLVSPDFMASDYCYSKEMTRAIERHDQKEARVIPVILRHAQWKKSPIGKLQALPTDGKPVKSWRDEDEAFFNVVEGIRKAIEELAVQSSDLASVSSTDLLEAAPPTFVSKNVPEQQVTVIDATPNQVSLSTANAIQQNTPPTEPIEALSSSQVPQKTQKKSGLQEVLTTYRNRLAKMEETLDVGATSQLTKDFAFELHKLLRQIISTIRNLPHEASYPPSIEYFKSKDDVLENLRQARIQVMMAMNSLPPVFMQSIFDQRMPETYYECLLSCREYLERTLNHW